MQNISLPVEFLIIFIFLLSVGCLVTVIRQSSRLKQEAEKIKQTALDRLAHTGELYTPCREWIQWSRYFAGIFVFLGLLGTVFGMTGVVANLAPSHQDSANQKTSTAKIQALQESMRGMLSEMSSAFIATLVGISATLIVSFANTLYLTQVQNLEAQIWDAWNQLEENDIPPQTSSGDANLLMAGNFDQLQDVVKQLTVATQRMQETLAILDTSTSNLHQRFTETSDRLMHSVQKSTNLLTRAADETTAQMRTTVEASTNYVKESITATVSTLNAGIADAGERLRVDGTTAAGEIRVALNETKGGLGELSQSLRETAAAFGKREARLLESLAKVEGNLHALPAATAHMSETVRLLKETLETDRKEQIIALTRTSEEIAQIQARLAILLHQFELTLTDVSAIADASDLPPALLSLTTELQDFKVAIEEEQKERNAVLTLLRSALATLPKREDLQDEISAMQTELRAGLDNVHRTLVNHTARPTPAPDSMRDVALLPEVARQVETNNVKIDGLMKEINATQTTLQAIRRENKQRQQTGVGGWFRKRFGKGLAEGEQHDAEPS